MMQAVSKVAYGLHFLFSNQMKRLIFILFSLFTMTCSMSAQNETNGGMFTRIAEVEVYPDYLDDYLAASKDVGEASVRTEPGVVCIYPMQVSREKNKIRILEIYRSEEAYQAHIKSPHFLKYKQGTLHMVKALDLVDVSPLDPNAMSLIFKKAEPAGMRLKKVITIEEHFTLPDISRKVMAYLTKQNGGVSPVSDTQKELMKIVLPTNDDIEDVGERRIRFMDEAGVDMQVLSYGAGSPQNITDKSLAIALCREANDRLAQLIARHPTRFAGFALLPVADPQAAADELERAVKTLGMKGAMLSGTFNGRFFDAQEFRPIFARAEALGVPIYLHPAIIRPDVAKYYYQSDRWSPVAGAMFATAGYGWHVDSGVGILRLIMSGIFEELPHLQIISGHWGELVPFYLNRLDDQQSKTLNLPRKISDYFKRNIYITPSGFFSDAQLKYAIETVGADRILYAADYPFLIDKATRSFLEKAPISNEDKEKIGYENVECLLRLNESKQMK